MRRWDEVKDFKRVRVLDLPGLVADDLRCEAAIALGVSGQWVQGWKRCTYPAWTDGLCKIHHPTKKAENKEKRAKSSMWRKRAWISRLREFDRRGRPMTGTDRLALRAWFEIEGGAQAFAALTQEHHAQD